MNDADRARVFAFACGALAAVIGAAYLALWIAGIPPTWSAQSTITTKANMALAQVLAGTALVLLTSRRAPRWRVAGALALSCTVAAVGLATVCEHLFGVDLGIDQLLFSEPPGAPGVTSPNRMGPPGATVLSLVGLGLILMVRRRGAAAATLGAVGFFVVLVPAVGVLYGAGPLRSAPRVTGISVATVVALSLLTVGLVVGSARGASAPLLWKNDPGGLLLRHMVVPALALPIALGYLRVEGERQGLFGTAVGTGLYAVALAVAFAVLLWRSALRVSAFAAETHGALRESEARLRGIFEGAAIGIVEADENDRITNVNGRLCEMLGYAREELLGKTVHDITDPEDLERSRELNGKIHTDDLPEFEYEKRYVRRDGSRVWVHVNVSVVRDAEGNFLRAIGTATDITDRKLVQEALRRKERAATEQAAELEAILNSIADGVVVYDREGRTVRSTPSADQILGIPAELRRTAVQDRVDRQYDVVGEDGRRILPDDMAAIRAAIHGEEVRGQVVSIRCGDGERRWLRLNATPLLLGDEPAGAVLSITDVTDRTRTERALRDSEARLRLADRRKSEFLSVLSHELRNPLAPIRASVYVLKRAPPGGDQAARACAVIERQTEHLTRLIDDLLDVTRIERGKVILHRDRVDLREVVRRATDDARLGLDSRHVTLRVDLPETSVWADADATRITQVLGNLLANARKFTRPGDEIAVRLRNVNATAEITVRDTGLGIDPELLPDVFEPFVQGKRTLARSEGGLGLGLALVNALVELHGGSVRAHSEGHGRGAEFVVTLPLVGPLVDEAASFRAPAARAAPPRRGVLVVDDNADAAESLAELVGLLGHRVDVAFDGPSAIAKAREHRPDVVLCDIGLPGMSGYDVARALRAELDGSVRLVAVSGYAQPDDVRKATEAGFDAHLAKPANPADIERLLA